MGEKTTGEEMLFEYGPKGAFIQFVAPITGYGATMASFFRLTVTEQYPREPARIMSRFHGHHQLNRYDDGLEKCIDCELCTWACSADMIFVEAASNTPEEQCSAGERYGHAYRINYLRCIFCGMCAEAYPIHTLTMTNDFEIAEYTQEDDIYEKEDFLVPFSDGMLTAPHPVAEGKNDIDYCRREVTGPTAARANWIASHRPGNPSLKTVRVVEEIH